jgi:hypothetical protein
MSLDTILGSIRAGLAAALPELKTVEVSGGNITLAEKGRRSRPLPAAWVFCAGSDDGTLQGNKVRTRATFVVILAVQARVEGQPQKQERQHQIARLAGRALQAVIKAGVWGDPEVESAPRNVDSRNKYTTDADKNDLALWAISWEQNIALADDPPPAELPDLLHIHAEWELQDGTTPAVDAVDDIEFTP